MVLGDISFIFSFELFMLMLFWFVVGFVVLIGVVWIVLFRRGFRVCVSSFVNRI